MREVLLALLVATGIPLEARSQTPQSAHAETAQTYALRVYLNCYDLQACKPLLTAHIVPDRYFVESRSDNVECPTDVCESKFGCIWTQAVTGVLSVDDHDSYRLQFGVVEAHPCGGVGIGSGGTPELPLGTPSMIGFCAGICRMYTFVVTRDDQTNDSRSTHSAE